jgi:flagellar hook-associated protein FlgK
MGLMDSLNVGMRGLNAAQTAIDVTGQNISTPIPKAIRASA